MNVGLAQADPYKHPFLQYQCHLATLVVPLHAEIRVTQPTNQIAAFQTPILHRQVNHMTSIVLSRVNNRRESIQLHIAP